MGVHFSIQFTFRIYSNSRQPCIIFAIFFAIYQFRFKRESFMVVIGRQPAALQFQFYNYYLLILQKKYEFHKQ